MCLPGGVSNRTVARASAANSRRSGATAALDRAQAHRDPVLGQQLLLHHVGVAAMPLKPFRQPVREPVQRLRPPRPPAARPAAKTEVALYRVPAVAKLGRDPLPAPSKTAQSQHRRHLVRRQHLLPPQIFDLRRSLAATFAHRPLLIIWRGQLFRVARGSVYAVARHHPHHVRFAQPRAVGAKVSDVA
jgi:hypothetical protein